MKVIGKIFFSFILLVIIVLVLALGYFGFIPGLSTVFGSDKPRDLGVKYTEEDRASARGKSKIEYEALPEEYASSGGFQTSGEREVSTQFSSAEMTALMNNRPWRYWPYKNVQVKFNADESVEISGIFMKGKLEGYGAKIQLPREAINFVNKYLPSDPVFYVKGKAVLDDNKVSVFEPQSFEIGRVPMPVEMFLAFAPPSLVKTTYASSGDMLSELSRVKNKRALIIEYINQRLTTFEGFYAKSARFGENKLIFDGTLPEKELTVR